MITVDRPSPSMIVNWKWYSYFYLMLAFGLGFTYLPSANEVWGKVICLQVCVCPQGGAVPACIAGGIPACLAAGLGGGGYPSMHCRWYTSMPCSRSWGVEGDLVQVQAHSHGGSWGGSGLGGCLAGGVPAPGGACSRGCLVETPTLRLLLRAVRILLECTLVYGTR